MFIVLVASYDLLLGYTGIVSFAPTMFFGIGAYGVAIAFTRMGPRGALAAGLAGAIARRCAGLRDRPVLALRVRAIFTAMITLAVASAFRPCLATLGLTGGEDGLTFKVPRP